MAILHTSPQAKVALALAAQPLILRTPQPQKVQAEQLILRIHTPRQVVQAQVAQALMARVAAMQRRLQQQQSIILSAKLSAKES